MRPVPYIMFRYFIWDEADERADWQDHREVIESVKGKASPRKLRDTDKRNFNNYVMRVRPDNIEGELVLIFDVGYRIDTRVELRWNRRRDEYDAVDVDADDTIFTRVICVPRLGIMAAKDGSGERLSAASAMARLRAIIQTHTEFGFQYERTASESDVRKAIAKLRILEFAFEVRPFNPHPKNPGEKLDDLMKIARVGRFRGKAEATNVQNMTSAEGGLVSEAIGLADEGYGQYSVKGQTKSGATVTYAKPPFSPDREKNEAAADRPRALKVAVPRDDPDITEEEFVIRVILELFDGE